jgi:hypothetical protein
MTLDKMSASLSRVRLKAKGKNGRGRDKTLENGGVAFEGVLKVNQGQSSLIKVEKTGERVGFRVWARRLENAVQGVRGGRTGLFLAEDDDGDLSRDVSRDGERAGACPAGEASADYSLGRAPGVFGTGLTGFSGLQDYAGSLFQACHQTAVFRGWRSEVGGRNPVHLVNPDNPVLPLGSSIACELSRFLSVPRFTLCDDLS